MAPPRQFGRTPLWRWLVTNLETETVTILDRLAKNRQLVYTLNAPAVATGDVPSDNPEVNIPYQTLSAPPFVHHNERLLYGFRREGVGQVGGGADIVHGNALQINNNGKTLSEIAALPGLSDFYLTFDFYVPQSVLDVLDPAGSTVFLDVYHDCTECALETLNLLKDGDDWFFEEWNTDTIIGPCEGDRWYELGVRVFESGGALFSTVRYEGAEVLTFEIDEDWCVPGPITDWLPTGFSFDNLSNIVAGADFHYIDNIQAGTIGWESDDLFSADFETGSLDSIFGTADCNDWVDCQIIGDAPDEEPDTEVTPAWVCRFAGPIMQMEDEGADSPTSHLTAYDPWQYLNNRPCRLDNGLLVPEEGYDCAGLRGDELALALLVNTETVDGPTFIDFGQNPEWEGVIQETSVLPEGMIIEHGTTVGEAWTMLAEAGYLDIILTPVYDPVNRPGICVDLNIYEQAGATDGVPDVEDDAVFAWDMPSRSLVGINRLVDGTQLVNRFQAYAGQGGDPVTLQSDLSSIARYGEYWAQQFFPGKGGSEILVETIAFAELSMRKNGRRSVALHPAPERAPLPFQEYYLGTWVPTYASKNLRQPIAPTNDQPPEGYQRIYVIPIDVDDDGTEHVRGLLVSVDSVQGVPGGGSSGGGGGAALFCVPGCGDGVYECDSSGNGLFWWDVNVAGVNAHGGTIVSSHRDGTYSVNFDHGDGDEGQPSGSTESFMAPDYVDPSCGTSSGSGGSSGVGEPVSGTAEGSTVNVLMDTTMLSTALPATSDFDVTVDGSPRGVSSVAVSGNTISLILASPVTEGQVVEVTYTNPAGVTPPTPPTAYTKPAADVTVSNSGDLVTELQGAVPKTIWVNDGVYTHTSYVTLGAAHQVYAVNLLGAQLQYGIYSTQNGALFRGLEAEVTDAAKTLNSKLFNIEGPNHSILDCVIKGGTSSRVIGYGVYAKFGDAPEGLRLERNEFYNFQDDFVYASDDTPVAYGSPTAEIDRIWDIYVENCKRNAGPHDGTGESGLSIGQPVTNGIRRIKARRCWWMCARSINNFYDTLVTDLDFDAGGVDSVSDGNGIGWYLEHDSIGCTFDRHIVTNARIGWTSEWDGTTPGNFSSKDCVIKNGRVEADNDDLAAPPYSGHRAGLYWDGGSGDGNEVHDMVLQGMNWAAIGNNDSDNQPAGNFHHLDTSGKLSGAERYVEDHISTGSPTELAGTDTALPRRLLSASATRDDIASFTEFAVLA